MFCSDLQGISVSETEYPNKTCKEFLMGPKKKTLKFEEQSALDVVGAGNEVYVALRRATSQRLNNHFCMHPFRSENPKA